MPSPSFYLKSLTLRSFRSVVDEQTIPLPRTGMHLLLGSSGAGKTTFGEGVAFALGYSNFSATDLQSWEWLTNEPLRDTLELETVAGPLRVTRGKGASILMPGEEKPRTSAKAVKEGLVQALGIDPEMYLAPLTYRSQKTPGLFLSMTDSEKKSFLTQLLGLDVFERSAEKTLKSISEISTEVERSKGALYILQGAVPSQPQAPEYAPIPPLEAKVAAADAEYARLWKVVEDTKALDVQLSSVLARRHQAVKDEWEPRLRAAKAAMLSTPAPKVREWEAGLADIRAKQAEHVRAHNAQVALLEKERETTQQFRVGFKMLVDKKEAAQRTLAQAQKDLAALEAQTCFTCGQKWNQNIKAWTQKTAERDLAQKAITDADLAAAQLPEFDQALSMLVDKLVALRATDPVPRNLIEEERNFVGAIASAKSEAAAQVSAAQAEYHRIEVEAQRATHAAGAMTPEEEQVRRTLGDLQVALSSAGHQLSSAKQAVATALRENEMRSNYFNQVVAARDAALKRVEDESVMLRGLEQQLAEEQDYLGMVRGFLSYIFDETLARIADATNARLALIPNVADVTLRFASERETASGKLRQEITAVCEKNGHTIPLKAGVSGGMYTAVELAVDLSLADVIADRTGVYPGWLILDEAFEGLDTPCKAACFDMLKDISKDRAVFVVDHTNEFKELFDSKIQVDFDGSRSKIVLL